MPRLPPLPYFFKTKCAICGDSNPNILEEHHISQYPEKIVLLCANHHARIHRDPTFREKMWQLLEMKSFPANPLEKMKEIIVANRRKKKVDLQKIREFCTSSYPES